MKQSRGWTAGLLILFVALIAGAEEPVPQWRQKFDEVYRLEENEILKRIEPPFIPERMDYYQTTDRSQAQAIPKGPDYYCFHWNGSLHTWGMGFVGEGGLTLSGVIQSVLDIQPYEFEGPGKLLSTTLKGDWIIKPDALPEEKLEALAAIYQKATNRQIEFQLEKVQRDVIVASGDWTFDTKEGRGQVILFADKGDNKTGGGGGSGSMSEFFQRLGSLMNLQVIDETTTKAPQNFQWRTCHSSYVTREKDPEKRARQTVKLLEVASRQTGVKFQRTQREVEVWMVREKQK